MNLKAGRGNGFSSELPMLMPLKASEFLPDLMATRVLFGADQPAEFSALSCAAQVTEKRREINFGEMKHCNVTSDGRGPQQI